MIDMMQIRIPTLQPTQILTFYQIFDTDSDNDGVEDSIEAGETLESPADSNDDGVADYSWIHSIGTEPG